MTGPPAHWPHPQPGPIAPPGDEVHVWRVSLDLAPPIVARLEGLLSAAEAERAHRFRFAEHRDAFVVARVARREILARYLGTAPERLAFVSGAHGKPAVAGEGGDGLRFSASDARGLALVAVARGREVGVDAEELRAVPDASALSARFLSAAEHRTLLALDEEARGEAFLRCWTRKEAYVKALGRGLAHPLGDFDVAFGPGEPARLLATRPDPDEAARWTMVALDPGDGYLAALVARGSGWRLRQFGWDPPDF